MKNELETFVIRGTSSDLDELSVVCGPAEVFSKQDSQSSFSQRVVMRPFVMFGGDQDGDLALVEGLWIEDKFLITNPDNLYETTRPGRHRRTHTLMVDDYTITLVEYEDRLQISVVHQEMRMATLQETVKLSTYKEKKYFGSIKLLMDECRSEEDVLSFVNEVGNL